MKVLRRTKKYVHVRISNDELVLLNKAILKDEREKLLEEQRLQYAEWFFTHHKEVQWQDEYSTWQSTWENLDTGKTVPTPDYYSVMIYRARFADIIKKNKGK
jgi:hypothetical protein